MIKSIYAVSLAIIVLLILTSCGILAAGSQAEDSPATEAAPQESAVEVVETEAPVEEPAPERVAETEAVVEAGDEAVAEAEEDVPDEALLSTEPVVDETAESEMAEAEAMPAEQPAEQPVADTAPSPEQQALLNELTVLGQPPELTNEIWLNSEPLKLADLRGQVVIVEFWTFG